MEMDWAMRGKVQMQIPAFGNWNFNHELLLPAVKQGFDDPAIRDGQDLFRNHFYLAEADHLGRFNLPPPPLHLPCHQQKLWRVGTEKKNQEKEKRHLKDGVLKEQKRPRRVYDEIQQRQMHQLQQQQQQQEQVMQQRRNSTTVKAVDEDLYKIPPELLYQKPKRKVGVCSFWKGCLV